MTTLDMSVFVNALVEVAGMALAAVATMLVGKAITAFEDQTNIQLTEQQRNTVYGAVNTAVGMVHLALQKGVIKRDDVHIANPQIAAIANAAMMGVQTAAGALGVTQQGAVNIIVGRVGHALHMQPPPVIVGTPQYTSGLLNVMPCATPPSTTSTTQGT